MPDIVVHDALYKTQPHGKHRLRPLERLALAFLSTQSMIAFSGRVEVETNSIEELLDEPDEGVSFNDRKCMKNS
jgi:hypothetical protein